jgi:hypothetical protein
MAEPEHPREDRPGRAGVVPALFLVWTTGLVAALLFDAAGQATGGRSPAWVPPFLSVLLGLAAVSVLVLLAGVRGGPRFPREPAAWLCPHCLTPHVPAASFCPHCSAPVSVFACTGPYEQVHAQAWVVGKAVRHPSRVLHATGLWGFALGCVPFLGLPLGLFLACLLAVIGTRRLLAACRARRAPPSAAYGAPPWWTFTDGWEPPEEAAEPAAGPG